ncbi:hypothetical protein BH24ACT3_BH24ACT3_19230 [soil metagenome]
MPTEGAGDSTAEGDEVEAAPPGYAAAMAELDAILDELEDEAIDVYVLAVKVRRAAELVRLCRSRIDAARVEVEQIVTELGDTAGAGGTAGPGEPAGGPIVLWFLVSAQGGQGTKERGGERQPPSTVRSSRPQPSRSTVTRSPWTVTRAVSASGPERPTQPVRASTAMPARSAPFTAAP